MAISTILGCLAIAAGISVGVDVVNQYEEFGVIITNEAIVRKGNGTNYSPMFQQPISEGVEFELIEVRTHWLHIQLPNGSDGWIHEGDAILITS